MARVTFEVPAVLRRYAGGESRLALEAASAGSALEALFARHTELRERVLDGHGRLFPYLLLFKNGEELGRDALDAVVLAEGDLLEMVGAAEGGADAEGEPAGDDVRMRGFRVRAPVATALEAALRGAAPLSAEDVTLECAAGRVLARSLASEVAVPPFRRAAMDGYAVRAEDTFGATLYAPLELRLVGESMPGGVGAPAVGPGEACRIMTGAAVPDGADAVLPAEMAREDDGVVAACDAVPPGKNVGSVGEDVEVGAELLSAGRRLRPQDVGLLASVGSCPVPVVRRPRVRLLMTGNELLAPGERPSGNRIVDSNTPMLAALVERDGGSVQSSIRVQDEKEAIRGALGESDADVILTSGGTSVGREDYMPLLVREVGELPVHGVAMRPAAPTGIGTIGATRVILLPGNPVACLAAYDFFAGPLIRTLAGLPANWPYGATELPLAQRIASKLGRTDYVRVGVVERGVLPIAISGASRLSSTTEADGFVIVPASSEGLAAGATVVVHLYDPWTFGGS